MSVLNLSFNSVLYLEVKRSFTGSLQIILWRKSVAEECSLRNSTLISHSNGKNQIKNTKVTEIYIAGIIFICNCPPTFKLRLFLQLSI